MTSPAINQVQSSREFQIFAKPVGTACNLNCTYCYYLDKSLLYGHKKTHHMTNEMLETYIRQHIEASTGKEITFSWHGGEPLLAGLDFYRKVVALQEKYNPAGREIINGIQTNGTLLNPDWCRFFAEAHFYIGISMDGPERLHDIFRMTRDGKSTFKKVMQGYDLLVMHGLDPEILCVVNAENVKHPLEVYRFFRKLGAPYLTFIPLVEKQAGSAEGVSQGSVPAEAFGDFLCAIFNEWVQHDIGRVKVQIFEEAARAAFGQGHTLCIFKPVCGGVPVVEHNGDFFSCDHFVARDHHVGNIRDTHLADLLDSDRQMAFGQAKENTLPQYCLQCEVRDMCHGECPKNRFIHTPDGAPGLNYLCTGYRRFFNHCRPFVEAVAKVYRDQKA
jgi:uncharacterized protein